MSLTFTKLFSSITESTIWCEPANTRLVWITMLAMSDRMGRVWASVPGLANRARVPLEDAEKALTTLLAPDRYSRTTDNEGRRIEVIDGGWRLLNHAKYRDIRDEEVRREQNRVAQENKRQRESADSLTVSHSQPQSAHADADTYTEKPKAGRAARLAADWALPAEWQLWALKEQSTWTPEHVRKVAAQFRNYWIAASGRNAAKLDWYATWQNWVWKEPALKGPKGEAPRPWFLTASGIEEKGRELGIAVPAEKKEWTAFRAAVYQRAGVTEEMLKRARADL